MITLSKLRETSKLRKCRNMALGMETEQKEKNIEQKERELKEGENTETKNHNNNNNNNNMKDPQKETNISERKV